MFEIRVKYECANLTEAEPSGIAVCRQPTPSISYVNNYERLNNNLSSLLLMLE